MKNNEQWWGYLHVDGHLKVKRYYSESELEDARESDFVQDVCDPVEAENREEAIELIMEIMGLQKEKA